MDRDHRETEEINMYCCSHCIHYGECEEPCDLWYEEMYEREAIRNDQC